MLFKGKFESNSDWKFRKYEYLILLLLLNLDGESLSKRVCVKLLLWPGRLVSDSMLSVSESLGATEYVLLEKW